MAETDPITLEIIDSRLDEVVGEIRDLNKRFDKLEKEVRDIKKRN